MEWQLDYFQCWQPLFFQAKSDAKAAYLPALVSQNRIHSVVLFRPDTGQRSIGQDSTITHAS